MYFGIYAQGELVALIRGPLPVSTLPSLEEALTKCLDVHDLELSLNSGRFPATFRVGDDSPGLIELSLPEVERNVWRWFVDRRSAAGCRLLLEALRSPFNEIWSTTMVCRLLRHAIPHDTYGASPQNIYSLGRCFDLEIAEPNLINAHVIRAAQGWSPTWRNVVLHWDELKDLYLDWLDNGEQSAKEAFQKRFEDMKP